MAFCQTVTDRFLSMLNKMFEVFPDILFLSVLRTTYVILVDDSSPSRLDNFCSIKAERLAMD